MRSERVVVRDREYLLFWPDRMESFSSSNKRFIDECSGWFLPILVQEADGMTVVDITGLRQVEKNGTYNLIAAARAMETAEELEKRGICVLYETEYVYADEHGRVSLIALPYTLSPVGNAGQLSKALGLARTEEERMDFFRSLTMRTETVQKMPEKEIPKAAEAMEEKADPRILETTEKPVTFVNQDDLDALSINWNPQGAQQNGSWGANVEVNKPPVTSGQNWEIQEPVKEETEAPVQKEVRPTDTFEELKTNRSEAEQPVPTVKFNDEPVDEESEEDQDEPKFGFSRIINQFRGNFGAKPKKSSQNRVKLSGFDEDEEESENETSDYGSDPVLYLSKGKKRDRKSIKIPKVDKVCIGRTKDPAEVCIVISDNSVSEKHAEIRYNTGKYWLRDVGSSNGTMLDGNQLAPHSDVPINEMSVIEFGNAQYYAIFEEE